MLCKIRWLAEQWGQLVAMGVASLSRGVHGMQG